MFLTNQTALSALTICDLYKGRWQVELFFKWIKQHLRIKKFYGTSENAVKTQIWIAVSVYVLVSHRPEAAEAGSVTLHIDAGVFGDSIRKDLDRICDFPSGRQFRTCPRR